MSDDDDHHGSGRVISGAVQIGEGSEGAPMLLGDGYSIRAKDIVVDAQGLADGLVGALDARPAAYVPDTELGARSLEWLLLDGNRVVVPPTSARAYRLPVLGADLVAQQWVLVVEWQGALWSGDRIVATASLALVRSDTTGWRLAGGSLMSDRGDYDVYAGLNGYVMAQNAAEDGDGHDGSDGDDPHGFAGVSTPAGSVRVDPTVSARSATPMGIEAGTVYPEIDLLGAYEASMNPDDAVDFFTTQAAETNQALNASIPQVPTPDGVPIVQPHVDLVGVVDSGYSSTSLDMEFDRNAVAPLLSPARDALHADLLAFLVRYGNGFPGAQAECGRGDAFGSDGDGLTLEQRRSRFVTVLGPENLVTTAPDGGQLNICGNRHVMAHEVGHNLGAGHLSTAQGSPDGFRGYYSNSYGFCASGGGDVMSEREATGCGVRRLLYSNPNVAVPGGAASGDAGHYNARAIAFAAPIVAGYSNADPGVSNTGNGRFTRLESPQRILDTRDGGVGPYQTPWASNGSRTVLVAGALGTVIPRSAAAAVVNITVINAAADGYLTAYAAGTPTPPTSTTNFRAGQTRAAAAWVPINGNGEIEIYTQSGTDVAIDVFGYVDAAGTNGGELLSTVDPARALDAEIGTNQFVEVPIAGHFGVPVAGATAVVVNLAADGADAAGFLTATADANPTFTTSVLNYVQDAPISNMAVIPLVDGAMKVGTSASARVIVDVQGYFSANGDLEYTPITPTRIYESDRTGNGGPPPLDASATRQVPVTAVIGPADVILANITCASPTTTTFLSAYPAGLAYPGTSNVNFVGGADNANHAALPLGDNGEITVRLDAGSCFLLVDVEGFFS